MSPWHTATWRWAIWKINEHTTEGGLQSTESAYQNIQIKKNCLLKFVKCGTVIITLTFIMNFTGGELVSPWSFEDDIVWFILSFVLVFWWWYCVIYFIICALNCGKYRHMVQCFVHSSTAIFVYTVVKMLWTHKS